MACPVYPGIHQIHLQEGYDLIESMDDVVLGSHLVKDNFKHPNICDVQQLQYIGEGTFGRVYEAIVPLFSGPKKLAIKKFVSVVKADDVVREMQALIDLKGAGVIHLFGAFVHQVPIFILERAQCSLDQYSQFIRNEHRLADARQRRRCADGATILEHLLNGLDAIHMKGYIHGDIKPDNLFIVNGIAKYGDLGSAVKYNKVTGYTTLAYLVGAYGYSNLELLEDKIASPASDIFALFASLFELVDGRKLLFPDGLTWLMNIAANDSKLVSYFKQVHLLGRVKERKEPQGYTPVLTLEHRTAPISDLIDFPNIAERISIKQRIEWSYDLDSAWRELFVGVLFPESGSKVKYVSDIYRQHSFPFVQKLKNEKFVEAPTMYGNPALKRAATPKSLPRRARSLLSKFFYKDSYAYQSHNAAPVPSWILKNIPLVPCSAKTPKSKIRRKSLDKQFYSSLSQTEDREDSNHCEKNGVTRTQSPVRLNQKSPIKHSCVSDPNKSRCKLDGKNIDISAAALNPIVLVKKLRILRPDAQAVGHLKTAEKTKTIYRVGNARAKSDSIFIYANKIKAKGSSNSKHRRKPDGKTGNSETKSGPDVQLKKRKRRQEKPERENKMVKSSDGSIQFKCGFPGCSRSYKTDTGLSRHKRLEHNPACPKYQCPYCRLFERSRKDVVTKHMKTCVEAKAGELKVVKFGKRDQGALADENVELPSDSENATSHVSWSSSGSSTSHDDFVEV